MADEILSKDELDALMDGVRNGAVDTEAAAAPGEVRTFDFASSRSARHTLPDLSPVHERCVRHLRDSLLAQMRCTCEISSGNAELVDYAGYAASLATPACLHLLRSRPLRGSALIAIEPVLVYAFVDHFFGGGGRFKQAAAGERGFSPAEKRVVQLLVEAVQAALAAAWLPVTPLSFEYVRAETNPLLAALAAPDDAVVVSRLQVVIDQVEGAIHFAMPYAMLDSLREHFDVRAATAVDRDERWSEALRDEILDAEIELASNLVQTQIRIGDFVRLRPGDVIPIDLPDLVTLQSEQVPLFHSRFGTAGGNNAVRLLDAVGRRPRVSPPANKELP